MYFFLTIKHFSYNIVNYLHDDSNLGHLPSLCTVTLGMIGKIIFIFSLIINICIFILNYEYMYIF